MSKQAMNIHVLPEFIANTFGTFGTSEVLVKNNNRILTIEPVLTDKPDTTDLEISLDKPLTQV
jgi:hypothetical protein